MLPAGPLAPQLAPLEVQSGREYVLGYPIHVGVTVKQGAAEGEQYLTLPYADEFLAGGAFGLSLAAGGKEIASSRPAAVLDRDHGRATYVLRHAEARYMLIDLAPLLPVTVRPGTYQAVLIYGAQRMRTASQPFQLQLREPNPAEAADLAALAPDLKKAESWGIWSLVPPAQPFSDPVPSSGDPARYNRVLRILFFAPQIPPHILEPLDGIYEIQSSVLAAELAKLSGDAAGFEAHSRQAFAGNPGVRWQIERITNSTSPVISRRKQPAG